MCIPHCDFSLLVTQKELQVFFLENSLLKIELPILKLLFLVTLGSFEFKVLGGLFLKYFHVLWDHRTRQTIAMFWSLNVVKRNTFGKTDMPSHTRFMKFDERSQENQEKCNIIFCWRKCHKHKMMKPCYKLKPFLWRSFSQISRAYWGEKTHL